MAYIQVPEGVPGIRSLVMFRPETGKHLYELAQVLLRGESPLTAAERELIAAYVSYRNECMFCMSSHAAAARCLYGNDAIIVDDVLKDMPAQNIPPQNLIINVAIILLAVCVILLMHIIWTYVLIRKNKAYISEAD